jgi:hypothetical protein
MRQIRRITKKRAFVFSVIVVFVREKGGLILSIDSATRCSEQPQTAEECGSIGYGPL